MVRLPASECTVETAALAACLFAQLHRMMAPCLQASNHVKPSTYWPVRVCARSSRNWVGTHHRLRQPPPSRPPICRLHAAWEALRQRSPGATMWWSPAPSSYRRPPHGERCCRCSTSWFLTELAAPRAPDGRLLVFKHAVVSSGLLVRGCRRGVLAAAAAALLVAVQPAAARAAPVPPPPEIGDCFECLGEVRAACRRCMCLASVPRPCLRPLTTALPTPPSPPWLS